MASDFYIVLGISRNADTKKIKQAYRKIVKQYHPDTTGLTQDPEKFREIQEAYETLGDEEKRRQYDTELTKQETPIKATIKKATPKRRSIWDEMDPYGSFTDEFLEGFLPGFFNKERYRSPVKDLYLEAILSPREARKGGMYPITIPVIEPCPLCQPSTFYESLFCTACNGYGKIKSTREFSLTIPPHVKNGTEIVLSLEDIGLKNVRLNIHVRVDPNMADEEW